jgi:hypothetical protein
MTIVLLFLAAGLIACMVAHQKGQAWAKSMLVVLVVAALLAAVWAGVMRYRKPTSAEAAADLQAEAGRALGEMVAAEVPAGDILIITYAPVKEREIFTDSRLRGLRTALTNAPRTLVIGGPLAVPDSPEAAAFTVFSAANLAPEINAWLSAHAEIKAVVSLMPYPPQGLRLNGRPMYCFAMREVPGWGEGLRGGGWKGAMLAHVSSQISTSGQTPAGWGALFDLVTPATLAAYQKSTAAPASP